MTAFGVRPWYHMYGVTVRSLALFREMDAVIQILAFWGLLILILDQVIRYDVRGGA